MIITAVSQAQVAEYYFTQANSTYTAITGGTVLWSGTLANEVSGAITIPSFTYNGTAYTSLYVSANGFITFGSAPAATTYTPISSSGSYAGVVSAFGRDLVHAATGSPEVRYEQVGSEFVIQWKDVRRATIASEIISFQVRLNTSNNYVYVVYGGTITPGSNTSYPQVGLRGGSTTDYNNRTILAAGGNWVNSTAGTAASNTMYFNSANPATVPSVGLTYTWKPLYNPTSFTATINGFTQIDLGWVKNSLNHNVLLAYTTDNVFGTPVSGATYSAGNTIPGGGTVIYAGSGTVYNHTSLNSTTTYYYKIWSYDAIPDYSSGVATSQFIAYPLTYLQDFPTTSAPTRWTTNMSFTSAHGTAGSIGLNRRLLSGATVYSAETPLIGDIIASTYLSFHYRFVNYDDFPSIAKELTSSDRLDIQVSLNGGSSYTTFHTIDLNNHTATTEFTNKVLSLSAYAGQPVKIKFLCNWGSGDFYVDIDNVLFENGNNMSYSTSTTEQASTANAGIGTNINEVIRLQVNTQKSDNPLSLTSITFTTTGSTSAVNDILAAKIYYTTTAAFSTSTQFGSTYSNPSGSFTVTGSQQLAQGNNYFWLAYDIKPTATAGNVVDGQCSSFITSESGTSKTPAVTNPTGARPLGLVFSGTKSIPADYATIAAAVTALNGGIVGSGGITFNVSPGHTETNANIILNATGTASNPIVFQKSGEGTNPLVTAGVGTSSSADGVIKIAGGDYITFDGIDVLDPVTNTTNNTRMEWGYALVKRQNSYPMNGCQNVIIRNCTITLQKVYTNTAGIHAGNHIATATTALAITLTTDAMNNCQFYNNYISNVYTGIELMGYNAPSPYTLYDQGNEIGVSGGNTITNYGGTSTATSAINTIYQAGFKIANNNISGGSATTQTLYGILTETALWASADIYGNTISLTPTGTTTFVYAIYSSSGSSGTGNNINIYNNIITNNIYSSATTAYFYGITNGGTPDNLNIYGNTITGNTLAGAGAIFGIDAGLPVNVNIYNNEISGNQKTGASGYIYCIRTDDSYISCHDNDIFNNSIPNSSGTAGGYIYGYYNENNIPLSEDIYNNDIYNLSVSGTSTSTSSVVAGIYTTTTSTLTANKNIYQNNIYGLSALTSYVYGIYQGKGSVIKIYGNNIYNLTTSSTSTSNELVKGITVVSGTNVYLYNNFISELKAPSAGATDAIRGISVSSNQANSNVNLFYNTVYLNASSSATNFGSTALYHYTDGSSTTSVLDLRNNILVNNSTANGTGYTVSFRRNTSDLDNYKSTSNNNIYHAGTPGTNYLIYSGGTTKQTIEDFRTFVGPNRDSISFSEIPPFINISTNPYNLRLLDGQASFCESGGQPITTPISVTTDYDGAARPATPDIGADEFSGIAKYVEAPASLTATSVNSQQIRLEFNPNSYDDNVVIVYNLTNTFSSPSGTPVVGTPLAGGTVLSIGTASPVTQSGCTPGTAVYYKAFSYDGEFYSLGVAANATPVVTPITGLTALHDFQTEINISWTKNIYNHDVIIVTSPAYMSWNPPQGTLLNVGDVVDVTGTVIYKGPLSAFDHTGLESWSQHYYRAWSVDIYNYYSTGVYTNEITDADPVLDFGYAQDFDGDWSHSPSAPTDWRVIDVGGSGSQTWIRNTINHSSPYSAQGLGSGTCNDYLITPPLQLPDTAIQISWYDKVNLVTNVSRYKVLLSTTTNEITSFTTELGNYEVTNTAWLYHSVDLSAYKGQTVYVAFYLYFTTSQYQYFNIDDIIIETMVPGPASLDFPVVGSTQYIDPKLEWNAPVTSLPVTAYKVYLDVNPNPSTLVYEGPDLTYQAAGLNYNTTYYWKVIPVNANGQAYVNIPVWSFHTISESQLAESFENAYFPPVSWQSTSGGWNPGTSAYHGSQSAARFTYNTVRPKLITPLLEVETGDKLEFYEGTGTKINNYMVVCYSTDKVDWDTLGAIIDFTIGAWGYHNLDLSALAGNQYYFAFEVWCAPGAYNTYVYIDQVTGPDIVPILPVFATDPVPADTESYIPLIQNLSWTPGLDGGIPDGYKIYLDSSPSPTTLVYNGLNTSYSTGPLDYGTTYFWKVVPYNSVGDAIDCPVWSFTTVPEGGVQIGRDILDYYDLPVNADYEYNYSQTIYRQEMINIPGKRLSKIYYYWTGAEEGVNFKDWVIYVGHTDKTEFTSITDWIPTSEMTKVFDGEVIIPYTDYIGTWVEIILDIPFEYNNVDNLVIAIDENTPGYSYNYFSNFYCTEDTADCSIQYFTDDPDIDPQNPPDADYISAAYPNIRMLFEGTPTTPVFYAAPSSKYFGVINIFETSAPKVFSIRNRGVGTLTITGTILTGADAGQFQMIDTNDYPVTLAANEAIYITASFYPFEAGDKYAQIYVSHNQSGSPGSISLTADCLDSRITTYPFIETFEYDSPSLSLWSQLYENGMSDWAIITGNWGNVVYAHTGDYNAGFLSQLNDSTLYISPMFNLTSLTNPELSFWWANENSEGYINHFRVYYRVDPYSSWIEIFFSDEDVIDWTKVILSLPNPSVAYQLAFEGIGKDGYPIALDDVRVGEPGAPETTWTGAVSDYWFEPGNWSDGIPTVNHAVIIDSGNFNPVIETSITVYGLTIRPGSTIVITSVGDLTVTGN